MNVQLVFFLFFISSIMVGRSPMEQQEETTIRHIVFIRTEGLALMEMVEKRTDDKDVQKLCSRIKEYYINTQPAILDLCYNKNLMLSEDQFESILNKLQTDLDRSKHIEDLPYYISLFENHINRSIDLYGLIVQGQKWESVSYFSLIALPELYNIKEEMRTILYR